MNWPGGLAERYASALVRTLEARGYVGFGEGIEVQQVVTPTDWRNQGMAAGTPFASAHTLGQTGPFRPGNLHPTLPNVVFTGSGTQPGVGVPMVLISGKLAAGRITAGSRSAGRSGPRSAGHLTESGSADRTDSTSTGATEFESNGRITGSTS